MNYRTILTTALILAIAGSVQAEEDAFTDQFPLGACKFKAHGRNPLWPLVPGTQRHFSNAGCVEDGECDALEEVWITVTHQRRWIHLEIDGRPRWVRTRVVEEFETEDGELVEVSRNYFVSCKRTGDVYYFGEDVDDYEDGEIVGHEGSWLAGRDGAMPGLIMPGGAFLLGSRYFQEMAASAQDRAEHLATGLEVEVPGGEFEGCVEIEETSPLEPGESSEKVYCPGIGLVIDDDLELVGDEEDGS